MYPAIQETGDGVSLSLVVVPRAGRDEVVAMTGDRIKIRLKAPPIEGRANGGLVAALARWLDVPRSAVEIVSGATGRHKVVHVHGRAAAEVAGRLSALLVHPPSGV